MSSISPTAMAADNAQHALTINGSSFQSGNVVQFKWGTGSWGNSNSTPVINSSSRITVNMNPGSVNDTIYVRVCRSSSATTTSDCSSGTHSVTVTALVPVPSVSSISPTTMVADNAQHALTINGSSFQSGNVVQFKWGSGSWGNSNSTPVVNSSTRITVNMNPGSVNDTIYVRACRSSSATTTSDCSSGTHSVTVTALVPVPSVTSISPTTMVADNAQHALTINGSSFQSGNVVQFKWGSGSWGNSNSTPVVNSSTRITVNMNPGSVNDTIYVRACRSSSATTTSDCSSGSHSVTVTALVPVPSVTSISPTTMVADNAQHALTINGSSFQSGNVVQFKWGSGSWGNSNSSPVVDSSTRITVNMNPGSVNDTIYVRVCRSSSATTTSDCSSGTHSVAVTAMVPVPSVSSISPTTMTADGLPHSLTINGSSFQSNNVVQFKWGTGAWGASLGTPTITVPSLITISMNPGTVNDVIYTRVCRSTSQTTTADCSSGTHSITVTATASAPSVSSINPTAMTADGLPHSLTINGSSFQSNNVVQFKWGTGAWGASLGTPTITVPSLITISMNPGTVNDVIYTRVCRSASQTTTADCSSGTHSITVTATASAPSVSSINPTAMTADGLPHSLTINGSSFQSNNVVQFKWGTGAWGASLGTPTITVPSLITISMNPGTVNDVIYTRVCRSTSQTTTADCSSGTHAVTVTAPALSITNVRASQLGDGTRRVEVLFNLAGAPPAGVTIAVGFSADGGSTWPIAPAQNTLSGAGAGIQNGLNKRVLWNASATLPAGTYGSTFKAKITALPSNVGQSANFTIDLRSGSYVEISTIASPQTAGLAFPVTFTVKGTGGIQVGWNGDLSLSVPPSTASTNVKVVAGVATKNVRLDTPGWGLVLVAQGGGLSGSSNTFDVSGLCTPPAQLRVTVQSFGGISMVGATVHLSTGETAVAGATGVATFSSLDAGNRQVWATWSGFESEHVVQPVTCNPSNRLVLRVPGSVCNGAGKTPVLLVPGIMGSTTHCGATAIYPWLTRNPPQSGNWGCPSDLLGLNANFHGLLDPAGVAGWRDLVDAFEAEGYELGCTLFPVPYDWRMDAPEAASAYLAPKVQEAKQRAGTNRVDIVAHSMGGLVARAYIDSLPPADPVDVDRLAMVGTPNHGSAMAYFLWEGGDPVLADAMGGLFEQVDFYRRTSRNLYGVQYGWLDDLLPLGWAWDELADLQYLVFKNGYRTRFRNYFHAEVPSLRLLLPDSSGAGKFLLEPGASQPRGIVVAANTNATLDALNTPTALSRLISGSANADPMRVRAVVFAADDQPTISSLDLVAAGGSSADWFYEDGRPSVDTAVPLPSPAVPLLIFPWQYDEGRIGDGTVRLSSALLPPASLVMKSGGASHAGLIGAFTGEIVSFVTGAPLRANLPKRMLVAVPQLAVRVEGRVQPLVTNSAGARSGVDPTTTTLHEEIPGGTVDLATESAGVEVGSPVDGSYTVSLGGAYPRDFLVSIDYSDDTASFSGSWSAYYDGTTPFTFGFSLDSQSPGQIAVNLTPPPPTGLLADYSTGFTHLDWEASPDAAVTAYAVYAKLETDAYLSPLGTSSVASFATGHDWAEAEGDLVRLYAVAARYADGHEGFLSNVAKNDDRDHDGMIDSEEVRRGTGVDDPDTDDDGLSDGVEDGLGTDPFNSDSDGDGYPDAEEVAGGSNPLDVCSKPGLFLDDFETGSDGCWS